ncbi:2-hydroxyhepta-2,4-diene-1,7-dioate isomerase, partial [Streptomyces stelliscabiei]
MKLLRVGAPTEERPAVRTDDGRLLDLSSVASDIDGAFLASGGVDRARAAVEAGGLPVL